MNVRGAPPNKAPWYRLAHWRVDRAAEALWLAAERRTVGPLIV